MIKVLVWVCCALIKLYDILNYIITLNHSVLIVTGVPYHNYITSSKLINNKFQIFIKQMVNK